MRKRKLRSECLELLDRMVNSPLFCNRQLIQFISGRRMKVNLHAPVLYHVWYESNEGANGRTREVREDRAERRPLFLHGRGDAADGPGGVSGMGIAQARQPVARHFGVGPSTRVRAWTRPLREEMV